MAEGERNTYNKTLSAFSQMNKSV